jgi:hypothetical protein
MLLLWALGMRRLGLEHFFRIRYNEGSIQSDGRRVLLADDKLYKAEYLGSGTFVFSKPKRKKNKIRQSQLRNPERGSRKP